MTPPHTVVAIAEGIATVPIGIRGDYTELALAVVQTAFDNIARYTRACERGRRTGRSEAYDAFKWALANDSEIYGLRWWCTLACVNADDIRRELLARWDDIYLKYGAHYADKKLRTPVAAASDRSRPRMPVRLARIARARPRARRAARG